MLLVGDYVLYLQVVQKGSNLHDLNRCFILEHEWCPTIQKFESTFLKYCNVSLNLNTTVTRALLVKLNHPIMVDTLIVATNKSIGLPVYNVM